MKAKIEGSKEFKPFDLTITVESVEELKSLWAAFNCNRETLEENANVTGWGKLSIVPYVCWDTVDNKCKEVGLLK